MHRIKTFIFLLQRPILKSKSKILPTTIFFENNILTNSELTENTLKKLIDVGYEVINKTSDDIYIKLK